MTAIEQDKLICFEWKGPIEFERFMNSADPLTHVSVFFLPCEGKDAPCTEVHVIHSGWRDSEEWEEARRWFDRAWREELEELRRLVDSK